MDILLVDDHSLFREGLKYALLKLSDDVRIFEAGNCRGAFSYARKNDFDIILLDIKLPDMSGIKALKKLRSITPATPIVILTASEEPYIIKQALDNGAVGYIHKSLTTNVMIKALKLVLGGGQYVPKHILKKLPSGKMYNMSDLTKRQMQILKFLKQGQSNKEIAEQLKIADNTVRVHISGIFQVLGVSNRTEAAMVALQEEV